MFFCVCTAQFMLSLFCYRMVLAGQRTAGIQPPFKPPPTHFRQTQNYVFPATFFVGLNRPFSNRRHIFIVLLHVENNHQICYTNLTSYLNIVRLQVSFRSPWLSIIFSILCCMPWKVWQKDFFWKMENRFSGWKS